MTDEKELRELELWVAEYVMLYKRGHPGGCATEYWQPPPYKFGVVPVDKVPHYTTDPAAAMMVLEKCVQKVPISVEICYDGTNWFVERRDGDMGDSVMAGTLPEAICRFARKLFEV